MLKPMFLIALATLNFTGCAKTPVQTGLDSVDDYKSLFAGKRVGIITNHTAYDSQNRHITDVFLNMPNVQVTALFGPEHGIRGQAEDGVKVASELDPLKNIPIYSLYGKTKKPTDEMLKTVDALIFDIQDIGARFYTYIYTMAYAMEAAAERHIPFVVLDRPNPINGVTVEGNILDRHFASFVGRFPIPARHGMTIGELAKMFNEEGWLNDGVKADLHIVPMKHWQRRFWYDETGLRFIKPSPNMPSLASATVYPGTCLIEGTNVSEGRGTPAPFQILGAPWMDAQKLAQNLTEQRLPGVRFIDTTFTPVAVPGAAMHPKYKDRLCQGITLRVTDRNAFRAFETGVKIIDTISRLHPDSLQWREKHFDRLCGTDAIRKTIMVSGDIDSLMQTWQPALQTFLSVRKKYLIY